jgi:hypothetical protein
MKKICARRLLLHKQNSYIYGAEKKEKRKEVKVQNKNSNSNRVMLREMLKNTG